MPVIARLTMNGSVLANHRFWEKLLVYLSHATPIKLLITVLIRIMSYLIWAFSPHFLPT